MARSPASTGTDIDAASRQGRDRRLAGAPDAEDASSSKRVPRPDGAPGNTVRRRGHAGDLCDAVEGLSAPVCRRQHRSTAKSGSDDPSSELPSGWNPCIACIGLEHPAQPRKRVVEAENQQPVGRCHVEDATARGKGRVDFAVLSQTPSEALVSARVLSPVIFSIPTAGWLEPMTEGRHMYGRKFLCLEPDGSHSTRPTGAWGELISFRSQSPAISPTPYPWQGASLVAQVLS